MNLQKRMNVSEVACESKRKAARPEKLLKQFKHARHFKALIKIHRVYYTHMHTNTHRRCTLTDTNYSIWLCCQVMAMVKFEAETREDGGGNVVTGGKHMCSL